MVAQWRPSSSSPHCMNGSVQSCEVTQVRTESSLSIENIFWMIECIYCWGVQLCHSLYSLLDNDVWEWQKPSNEDSEGSILVSIISTADEEEPWLDLIISLFNYFNFFLHTEHGLFKDRHQIINNWIISFLF